MTCFEDIGKAISTHTPELSILVLDSSHLSAHTFV